MSAISLNMRKHYGPLLNGFYHIPFPDKYRGMYLRIFKLIADIDNEPKVEP
jgi:4-aminobutyrate aminotransferase-like enzyme